MIRPPRSRQPPSLLGSGRDRIQWRILHDELRQPGGGRARRRDRQVPADRGRGRGGRASARPGALADGDGSRSSRSARSGPSASRPSTRRTTSRACRRRRERSPGPLCGDADRGSPTDRVRGVASFLRGILVTLYLLVRGVTSGSRIGMFAVALALAVGGALLGLALVRRAGARHLDQDGARPHGVRPRLHPCGKVAGPAARAGDRGDRRNHRSRGLEGRVVRRPSELVRAATADPADRPPRRAHDAARRRAPSEGEAAWP